MKLAQEKRFALLLAANDSNYVKKNFGGYFNVFVSVFGDEDEIWDLYRVVDGEFPKMEDLKMYDGFVISGSPYEAYGNDPWILRLCLLLQTLSVLKKRVLGICFGHQVLCRALGGKVSRAKGGWDIGIRKVTMVAGALRRNRLFIGLDEGPTSASIIECHHDEVWEVPLGADVIAFSGRTAVEAFCIDDHILGIQGHPEYTKDILYNLTDRLSQSGAIDSRFKEEIKVKVGTAKIDREFWEKLCKGFLKKEIDP